MCCFGIRIFLLFFITAMSFGLARYFGGLPVVGYYLVLANLLAFLMMSLFFAGRLPAFVKPNAIHYFSLIGGVCGSLCAMAMFRRFARDTFTYIQIFLLVFWLFIVGFVVLNFDKISAFFQGFLP